MGSITTSLKSTAVDDDSEFFSVCSWVRCFFLSVLCLWWLTDKKGHIEHWCQLYIEVLVYNTSRKNEGELVNTAARVTKKSQENLG